MLSGSFQNIFSSTGFMPHIHCYLGRPGIVWTMVSTDTVIGLSYVLIASSLYALVRKIQLPFSPMFLAFGLFIFACGMTHFMEVYTLWVPAYWATAVVKFITAIASISTAIYLLKISPDIYTYAEDIKKSRQRADELAMQSYELIKINEELRKAKDRFRLMVEGVKDYAIFMINKDGIIETWNEGATNLKQYTSEEIIGKSFNVFYTPEDLAIKKPQYELREALARGRYEDEGWRLRKDGSIFWANVIITPVKDSEGVFVGFSKVTRDLTERKKSEKALQTANSMLENRVAERTLELQESEEQFRTFANSMPQLAWMARPDGHIFWYNKGWYDYTGIAENDRQKSEWKKVYDPLVIKGIMAKWKETIRSQKSMETTFQLKGVDGIYRWFIARVIPIFNNKGELTKWVGTNTNIDEQKKLQDELQKTIQSRDDFLSVASHELKTPLTTMSMQLQMLQRKFKAIDEFQFRLVIDKVGVCLNQSQKLSALTDELLDLTRIRAGKLNLDLTNVDLIKLIKNTIDEVRVQLKNKSETIIFQHEKKQSVVGHWDRMRVEQVVTNLISNAIKYGGGKNIHIKIEKNLKLDEINIVVTDHGIGMSPELQQHIFERFARGSYDNRIAGLGLGLYITKQIVEAHNGKIEVISKPGLGSTFIVTIPTNPIINLTQKAAAYEMQEHLNS